MTSHYNKLLLFSQSMNIDEYLTNMKDVQMKLLKFLEYEYNNEENYDSLMKILDDINIKLNEQKLKTFLYLLNQISNEHHRNGNFIKKVENIIANMKNEMIKYFSNYEIFKVFKKNKRLLLFLFEEKIVIVDKNIYDEMMKPKYRSFKYPEYFSFEIMPFFEDEFKKNQHNCQYSNENRILYEKIQDNLKENKEQFNEKRRNGENDGQLYKIIQKDLIEEFIIYMDKNSYPLQANVEESIFETNPFLLKRKETTLIEYAAFFGSIQIFKYLYKNGINLNPSLWLYGIHGDNEEIFHILDYPYSTKECIHESIKCHHNHIANYIQINFLNENEYCIKDVINSFHYYNFSFFPEEMVNDTVFLYACKYDYFTIVQYLLSTKKINLNYTIILEN